MYTWKDYANTKRLMHECNIIFPTHTEYEKFIKGLLVIFKL